MKAQKGIKHWILNRFLLVNSEMWIRTAIKLPHDLGVCQKTVGNSAGDFHGGGERKTPTSWIRTAIKSPTTPCIWWKSLVPLRNNYRPNRAFIVLKLEYWCPCKHKPYSDGNCFSGGHKWFSPDTGGSWWFNCRPNPGCRCFSLTTPVKIPGRITYCFWQTPRSCGNLIAVRIHISEFTRRHRFSV